MSAHNLFFVCAVSAFKYRARDESEHNIDIFNSKFKLIIFCYIYVLIRSCFCAYALFRLSFLFTLETRNLKAADIKIW